MNIFKKLFGKKAEPKKETINLSALENHYIIKVGFQPCDFCKQETINCCKLDIADQSVCICPRKDIRSFRKPKSEE